MNTITKDNKDTIINRLRQAIAGIQQHFTGTTTIGLSGTPTPPTAAVATLQGAITAIDAAATAEQAFHTAVAAQNAAIEAANALLVLLLSAIKSQLGSTPAILGDFGFDAPKRTVPTEAVKAAAVQKRAATRVARGTKGPKAKLAIKGNVPPTPATPATPAKPV